MKKLITSILTTSGISIVVLAAVVFFNDWDIHFYTNIAQLFGANIIVHIGLILAAKFNHSRQAVAILIDIICISVMVLAIGSAFGWLGKIPVPLLMLIAIGIYTIAYMLNLAYTKNEIAAINKLLHDGAASKPLHSKF